jgi:hypothetical protein
MLSHKGNAAGLPVIHDRAAGIDVGSRFRRCCGSRSLKSHQTFQAFTSDLQRMADRLVAMGLGRLPESTGVLRRVRSVGRSGIEVILANARSEDPVASRMSTMRNGCSACTPVDCCGQFPART